MSKEQHNSTTLPTRHTVPHIQYSTTLPTLIEYNRTLTRKLYPLRHLHMVNVNALRWCDTKLEYVVVAQQESLRPMYSRAALEFHLYTHPVFRAILNV